MLNLIEKLFSFILDPLISLFDFPAVPAELASIINQVFEYMKAGMSFVNLICPLELITPAIDVFLAVYLLEHGYHIVMWVIRKIPMIGMS